MKSRRFLPLLLVLFVGSGCAALIYEIVWFQLLQLVIGSTAVSMGVLLGTFMGGMCIGSLALPKYVSARRHPLRVYAALELGIGVVGAHRAARDAVRGRRLHGHRGPGRAGRHHASAAVHDPAAPAHDPDGRVAAGHRPVDRDHARGRVVARLLLRRQHRRRGGGLAAGRVLPAARARHAHHHVRGVRPEPRRGAAGLRPGRAHHARRGGRRRRRPRAANCSCAAPGRCTW